MLTFLSRHWLRLTAGPSLLFITLTLLACGTVEEQRHYTVGLVNPNKGTRAISVGFMEGLREYGNASGMKITFLEEECASAADVEAAMTKLIDTKVDLIFAVTTPAAKKAAELTKDNNLPVIFAIHDPVKAGLMENLSQPPANLTGVQIRGSIEKAVEWLQTLCPQTHHIFVPIKFDTKAAKRSLAELKTVAKALGLKCTVGEVNTPDELTNALNSLPEEIDAIFLLHSMFVSTHARRISDMATSRNIPVAAAIGKVDEGALIAYSPQLPIIGKQASRLAHQSLQGIEIPHIPTEIADYFLGINLHTAERIGLQIPDRILRQADTLIR